MKTKEKTKSWRSNYKYPNLDKRFTLLRRREFLDTEYITGVLDEEGLVIRKLNDKELKWLNKFYKETLSASFTKTDSFFPIEDEKLDADIIKRIIKEFLNPDKSFNWALIEYYPIVEYVAYQYDTLPETVLNLLKRKEIYDANNALNRDILKNGLRTTCENTEDLEQEFYHPLDYLNRCESEFENAMNSYMDYAHRKKMGWPDLND